MVSAKEFQNRHQAAKNGGQGDQGHVVLASEIGLELGEVRAPFDLQDGKIAFRGEFVFIGGGKHGGGGGSGQSILEPQLGQGLVDFGNNGRHVCKIGRAHV